MVSIIRISILFFVAIFIQNSLHNKIDKSINNSKDISTSKLTGNALKDNNNNDDISNNNNKRFFAGMNNKFFGSIGLMAGGHGQLCYTRNELKMKIIHHGGRAFKLPYYAIVRYCNKF